MCGNCPPPQRPHPKQTKPAERQRAPAGAAAVFEYATPSAWGAPRRDGQRPYLWQISLCRGTGLTVRARDRPPRPLTSYRSQACAFSTHPRLKVTAGPRQRVSAFSTWVLPNQKTFQRLFCSDPNSNERPIFGKLTRARTAMTVRTPHLLASGLALHDTLRVGLWIADLRRGTRSPSRGSL